ADPIVSLLFQWMSFDAVAAENVAIALRCYGIGLAAWGLTGLCGRFFAARMEQSKSTMTSLVALAANISISIALVQQGMGIAGLALGTTVSFVLCAAMRLWMLNASLRAEGIALRASDVLPSVGKTSLATAGALLAMLVAYAAVRDYDALPLALNRVFVLFVPLGFGVFAYCAVGLLLRSEQIEEVVLKLGRRGRGSSTAASEPQPVNPYCMDPPRRLLAWVKANPKLASQENFIPRITTFLNNKDWAVCNVGIELIGELRLPSFRHELAEITTCREPAPWAHRVLGGDFVKSGFLRRNAITALERLGETDALTERCLLMALGDPYFEVRSEAARVLGRSAESLGAPAREEAVVLLAYLAKGKYFEVAAEAVTALGHLALDAKVVDVLKTLHYHRNWQVRDRVVQAYGRLFARRIVANRTHILALLQDVLTTSEGFIPRFVLKEHMAELQDILLRDNQGPGR
ncbi:MAG: HEAT repeat domain-containing protein, partial [Planctomycetes bacterium]|nr:HEAT repeat domain-containing protein [Planctomycetota bacterium]